MMRKKTASSSIPAGKPRVRFLPAVVWGIMTAILAPVCLPVQTWADVRVSESFLYEYDEASGDTLGSGHIQTMLLPEEESRQYPELAQVLETASGEKQREWETQFAEYCGELRQEREEYEAGYEISEETDVYLRRFDDRIFSYLEYGDTYTGGAHGYYWFEGYNYHPEDGREITLEEVIRDSDRLGGIIADKIFERYPELLQIEE